MKIGIDARLWNESGVGRYIRNLVFELIKIDKINNYVLFVRKSDIENIKNQIAKIKEWKMINARLPARQEKWKIVNADVRWHTLSEQLLFPSILNKENLDLVHFPYFSVPLFYNKPFVVTIHDLILHHFSTGEASTLFAPFYYAKLLGYHYVIAQATKRAKKILTVSHVTEKEIADHLKVGREKIVVAYEGVDPQIVNYKSKVFIKQPYFLYVGNAYPHKNLTKLVDTFFVLKKQKINVKLVLVGKEDFFYKKLKKYVDKLSLQDMVVFYGEAKNSELSSLFQQAKALVMSSLMEGFGLPIIEAMANKCLVLASDIPAHREIAGDAAIYFDPTDASNLSKKLKEIYNNYNYYKYYSNYIRKGILRVKMFSWEKMAKETLRVYESCVSI